MSPRVRKQATAWRARWWSHPCVRSCVMAASIQGKPVRPSVHAASSTGSACHGIWRQLALPTMWSKLGVPSAAA
jgi:hypothetical protein